MEMINSTACYAMVILFGNTAIVYLFLAFWLGKDRAKTRPPYQHPHFVMLNKWAGKTAVAGQYATFIWTLTLNNGFLANILAFASVELLIVFSFIFLVGLGLTSGTIAKMFLKQEVRMSIL